MSALTFGLLLNFSGSVMLAFSAQVGLATAYGGKIVWRTKVWRFLNLIGWVLLALGFVVQIFAAL